MDFYVTRDITPQRWYAKDALGHAVAYDDLPAQYHDNINRDPPFADQKPGAAPHLTSKEIDDVVAFMQTLTDGYLKDNPYRAERLTPLKKQPPDKPTPSAPRGGSP